MITNATQLRITQQRIQEFETRLQAMDSSKDALLRNPVIKKAYEDGIKKIIADLNNQINVYKAKGDYFENSKYK
jgi:hypothetical protein